MANENLSGVPPTVTLSGLNAGEPSIGGTAAPGISGAPGQGGAAGFLPGMEGGLDLATLMQMLQAGETPGIGSVGDINQSLMQGSFGQQQGGVSAGSLGQTQPGYVAGQSSAGVSPAMQAAAAGSADPLSVIQKYLGVAAQGARAVQGALTASPTAAPTAGGSGATPAEQQAFTTGIASPVSPAEDLAQSGIFKGGIGGTSALQDPTLDFLFTSGALNGMSPAQLDQISSLPPDQLAGLRTALLGGETQSDLGSQLLSGQGGSGFTLGTGGLNTAMTGGGGPMPDVLGGGVGLLNGLMSLYGGAQSGNVGSLLGGAGSTLSGLNQLSPGMGLGDMGSSLGLVGGAVNAPFAALNLVNAIDQGDPAQIAQSLAGLYGTTVPVINAIFGTSLPTLTSLAGSALASLGSTIGGSLGSTIGSLGASLGGSIGGAAGSAGGAAAASGAASAGAGAAGSAAGAAAALPLAMITGPYVVAKLIQAIYAMGPDKANARELGIRTQNIGQQLPGEIAQLQSIPQIAAGLNADSTPEQAASILKQLNDIQQQYQAGGWESHQKQGSTTVESVGEGNMTADLPGVQRALDAMSPYLNMLDISRLRGQDVLANAGWTPEQIKAQTGRYVSPAEFALMANAQSYNSGTREPLFANFNPTFNEAWRPAALQGGVAGGVPDFSAQIMSGQLDPTALANLPAITRQQLGLSPDAQYTNQDLANYFGSVGAGQGSVASTPFGMESASMQQALAGLKPGSLEQQLGQFLQPYGGINPLWQQLGFGQGLVPGLGAAAGVVPPQILEAANAPAASTAPGVAASPIAASPAMVAGVQPLQQGRMTEETLMDILRRMSPGAAYAGV